MSDKSGKWEVKPSPQNEQIVKTYFDLHDKNWFNKKTL